MPAQRTQRSPWPLASERLQHRDSFLTRRERMPRDSVHMEAGNPLKGMLSMQMVMAWQILRATTLRADAEL